MCSRRKRTNKTIDRLGVLLTMKRILCYGDSNTWGAVPGTKERFDENTRYPKVLQKLLGDDYEVIEEGLRERTAVTDDIVFTRGNNNGALCFLQSVYTHDPLDFVVIMLGTNDMKEEFHTNPKQIAKLMEDKYIKALNIDLSPVLVLTIPKIIIVAPGEIKEGLFAGFDGAEDKSKSFNEEYKKLAEKTNCLFVSNENLIAGCDGIHLTEESHKHLAKTLCNIIK